VLAVAILPSLRGTKQSIFSFFLSFFASLRLLCAFAFKNFFSPSFDLLDRKSTLREIEKNKTIKQSTNQQSTINQQSTNQPTTNNQSTINQPTNPSTNFLNSANLQIL
jgi:hypothetical protein